MLVEDMMTRKLTAISADATIAEVAAAMRNHDIGLLPVASCGRVIGVVSDRDITIRAVAAEMDPTTTKVRHIITEGAVWCHAHDSVEQAATLMKKKQIRRLLVADQNNRPVGIVSLGDLATKVKDKALVADVLEHVSRYDLVEMAAAERK